VRGRCDEAQVFASAQESALTRFARSRIHQNCHERQLELLVTVNRDGRIGRAGGNQGGPGALDRLAAAALEAAEVAPPDPGWPGVAGPEPPAAGDAWAEATAEASSADRAGLVAAVCRAVPAPALAYGGLLCAAVHQAAATTAGLRTAQRRTHAEVRVTVHAPAGAGYAARVTGDLRDLGPLAVAAEALDVASLPGEPRPVPPGDHRVVLAPYAIGRLLEFLSFLGFPAARHREGRSFMRLGELVTGRLVTIVDDGGCPDGIPVAFDCEGTPKRRVELIREGVAVGLVHDRASAAAGGVRSTGHAAPAAAGDEAYAASLFLDAGPATLGELLAPIDEGLLVTRVHYVSILDPLRAVVTGVTRDGTAAVRGGRLAGPAADVRFQAGLLDLLDGLEAVGAERRTLPQTIHGFVTVPHVRLRALPVV
jgi:PmbA protein